MQSEINELTIAVLSDSSGKLPNFVKWTSYAENVAITQCRVN